MPRKISLMVVLLVIGFAPVVPAGSETETIRAGALRCAESLQRGDYVTFAELTYPKLVALFGGREKMIEVTRAAIKETETKGVKLVSFTVGEPAKGLSSNKKLFSVVPTVLTMTAPDARITKKSFLLAISSDNGSSWTFIDGSGLTSDLRAKVVPDLPASLRLPKKEVATIEHVN